MQSLHALKEMTEHWNGVAYYKDGALITNRDLYQEIWHLRNKRIQKETQTKRMKFMEAIIPELADERQLRRGIDPTHN